jgi:thioester reductase-like protein
VEFLKVDLSKPLLGLKAKIYKRLRDEIDAVIRKSLDFPSSHLRMRIKS